MPPPQHLTQAALSDLRPTQMTVGLAEVAIKRAQWAQLKRKDREHLGVALLQEKTTSVWIMQLADYSDVPVPMFWRLLEFHQWAHPYDAKGRRQPFSAMPQKLEQLSDDPYRSLAGEVRKAGGYAKDATPFAEFIWADFFRPLLPRKNLRTTPAGTLEPVVVTEAVALAHSQAARCLPGWSGTFLPAATPAL